MKRLINHNKQRPDFHPVWSNLKQNLRTKPFYGGSSLFFAGLFSSLGKDYYRLDLVRPREHVDRFCDLRLITLSRKSLEISGKSLGTARDINDLGRL